MAQRIAKTHKIIVHVVAVVGLLLPVPAAAQFGFFKSKPTADETENPVPLEALENGEESPESESTDEEGATSFSNLCGNGQGKPEGPKVEKRKGIFGMADRMSAFTRKIPLVGDFMVDSANSLSQTIACKLYPEEQKQAAEATEEATRGAEIGKKVEWTSSVRENVSGSSTVSDKNQLANGTPCLVISDIIIIEGEETQVSKKMCRLPGSPRYTIMAA
ncbi:MAG: hypothetical protein V7676_08965 [Parasphingorhabdus sp.]|uniref:hypothetical protein n=1 Tax=Parasphingorhabdus sp. TaxID=2709688 RepID=UPI003001C9A0